MKNIRKPPSIIFVKWNQFVLFSVHYVLRYFFALMYKMDSLGLVPLCSRLIFRKFCFQNTISYAHILTPKEPTLTLFENKKTCEYTQKDNRNFLGTNWRHWRAKNMNCFFSRLKHLLFPEFRNTIKSSHFIFNSCMKVRFPSWLLLLLLVSRYS